MSGDETALRLPEQTISAPRSISPQAQAYLAAAAKRIAEKSKGGTASLSAGNEEPSAEMAVRFLRPLAERFKGVLDTIALPNGARLYRATPEARSGRFAAVAYFDIHGGGFSAGGGEMCLALAKIRACDLGVEVFAIDYRLAPLHPFPAALDDCVAAYSEILGARQSSDLVVAGSSAGGNLAAALMLRARNARLPLPAGVVLMTPALDLTCAGDTYRTNRYLDVNLYGDVEGQFAAYSGGSDLLNPICRRYSVKSVAGGRVPC